MVKIRGRASRVPLARVLTGSLLTLFVALTLGAWVPALAPAAEGGGATAAKESEGDDFDLSPVVAIVGGIVLPALTFGAGFVTDRKKQTLERNREQAALADEFLESSGDVVQRLEKF